MDTKLIAPSLLKLSMIAAIGAGSAAQASPLRWNTYVNARFGYSVCYPAGLLVPGRESDNSDGRSFYSKSGAQLDVWGINDIDHDGYARELGTIERDMKKAGMRVTYRAHGRSWGVISGASRKQMFYAKTLMNGDQRNGFQLVYRRSDAARFAPIATKISACFRRGTPAY